jgi:curved DNA-binding protein CbpA
MRPYVADPYAVLGVPRGATRRQAAEAYRRLAKRHHPDVDPDPAAVERMRRINAAWQVLSSPTGRAERSAVTAASGHWTSSRRTARSAGSASAADWTTWGDPSRPWRPSGPAATPRRRRPARSDPADVPFQDTGWAALLAATAVLAVLLAAAYAGTLSTSLPPG